MNVNVEKKTAWRQCMKILMNINVNKRKTAWYNVKWWERLHKIMGKMNDCIMKIVNEIVISIGTQQSIGDWKYTKQDQNKKVRLKLLWIQSPISEKNNDLQSWGSVRVSEVKIKKNFFQPDSLTFLEIDLYKSYKNELLRLKAIFE